MDSLEHCKGGVLGESPFNSIRHPKKRAYLRALVEAGGNVTRACELAAIDRSTPYTRQWQEDAEFQTALVQAKRMAAEALESEAIRRGFQGVSEPVGWYKGEPGGYVTKYSDTLLIFLLKGAYPERYSERHEVRGAFAHIDLTKLPDEAVLRIASGEHPQSVLASLAGNVPAGLIPEGEAEPVEDE
jgi:hypothetical protein